MEKQQRPFEVVVWEGFWKPEDCAKHPDWLFVFGDNLEREGCGGQAVIRECTNAFGVATKKAPNTADGAYMTDAEYWKNIYDIDSDLNALLEGFIHPDLSYYNMPTTICFSNGGYGTGLAKLPEKAPQTFDYLCERLQTLFGFDNRTGKLAP